MLTCILIAVIGRCEPSNLNSGIGRGHYFGPSGKSDNRRWQRSAEWPSTKAGRQRRAEVLLNLADVIQLDSSSISAINGTYVSLSRQGGSLKVLHPRGRVRAVLQVVRLPDIIPTFEDEAQALASFRPEGYSARP